MTLPTTLAINAWLGENAASATSDVSAKIDAWMLRAIKPGIQQYLPVPPPANPANWQDPSIGWGLILVEREGLSNAVLASGADAPEPIQALLKARGNAPVFRYRPKSPDRFTLLRNYAAQKDVPLDAAPIGTAADALPHYLLIYGSPAEIPWELQYTLNASCAVGRLDIEGDALANYVQALLSDWKDATSQIEQAVAWAVDFGLGDISHLMRNSIAAKVYAAWSTYPTLHDNALFIDGSATDATAAALIQALSEKRPALVVTTSHGQTGPLSDPVAMKAKLGLPVDQDLHTLEPDALLAAWQPDGAIWYAHACCSAGSSSTTLYGCIGQNNPPICLVKAGSSIDQVLQGVAGLGSLIAPLPRALLGAKKPLRAFIGHVEPTFDWTIKQPRTGQFLTASLQQALYTNIYTSQPIGLALHAWYESLAALSSEYEGALDAFNHGEDTLETLLYCQLAERDRKSMVILGDPTATLPKLS